MADSIQSLPAFASPLSILVGHRANGQDVISLKRRRARCSVPVHASTPLTVKATSTNRRRSTASESSWRALNQRLVSEARHHGEDTALATLRDLVHAGRAFTQNFNQMVSILVSCKRFNDAFAVATDAGERGLANIVTFRPLMKHCCSTGDGRTAKRVWRSMMSFGIEADMFVYAELMGALVRSQDLRAANKVLTALTDAGVRPHIVLYNTLLKGYAKTADVRLAFDTLDKLESSGVSPDETTFNTLLNTCVRSKDAAGLERAIARMGSAGIKPGVPTFNTLLKLYARSNNFDNALEIYREMQETLEPSIVTFNTLIDGCAHRGDMDQAAHFFDEMVSRGHDPDICTMTSLLKGFGRANEPSRAVELFDAMTEGGFEIEDRTRYAVINACLRSRDRVSAKKLMRKMLKEENFVCRARTFVWLLECDLEQNDEESAVDTLEMMLDYDVKVEESSKSDLLKGLWEKNGWKARVRALVEQLPVA